MHFKHLFQNGPSVNSSYFVLQLGMFSNISFVAVIFSFLRGWRRVSYEHRASMVNIH